MLKLARTVVLIATLAALALVVEACGSSSSSGGAALKPAQTGAGQTLTGGVRGGTLTVYSHEDFQHLDPGQSYFGLDYPVLYATQRPLFSYKPDQAETLSPDLASGPAVVSDGGKTVTVHIRSGVHFSPPVNREATSADVAYAIERGANPTVANPYFPVYFNYLVGGAKATGGPIQGISTPDQHTIVFHLTGPYAGVFIGALSLPISAPVPKEYAAKYDAQKPTAYGSVYEVATGPYMLKADASGKFQGIGYQPGKSATLVRNPNWSAATDSRPAYLDQVNFNIGGDPNVIGRQVLQGSHAVQEDTPASAVVELAYKSYYDQLLAVPGSGVRLVAVNNAHGPFANPNVRKAFFAALDRNAMLKVRGGQIVANLATHFIYPGTGGYQEAGGAAGPQLDFAMNPSGNAAVAAKYMKLGGYPTGRYTGGATIKVVGSTGDPADKDAQIVNRALQSLGFNTNLALVDQATMYGKYCGVPSAEVDVCPNVGLQRDFADAQTILAPAFAGYNIVPSNNTNWGQVNDPQINAAMKAAEKTVGDQARATAWGNVDTMLVQKAVAVPWDWDNQPAIRAADVRGIADLWNSGTWDYSYTSLK